MKRGLSVLLVVLGAVLFLFGLLFFVGAGGQGYRYAIAAVGLASGAVLIGFGIRWYRAAEADAPEQILAEILAAARKRNGELAEIELGVVLGRRAPRAAPVLAKIVAAGLCERRVKEGGTWYVIRDLQPRLFVRKCQFCGYELSIASEAQKCPRCGGAVASAVARRALSDDAYRMDDE